MHAKAGSRPSGVAQTRRHVLALTLQVILESLLNELIEEIPPHGISIKLFQVPWLAKQAIGKPVAGNQEADAATSPYIQGNQFFLNGAQSRQ